MSDILAYKHALNHRLHVVFHIRKQTLFWDDIQGAAKWLQQLQQQQPRLTQQADPE